MYTEDTYEGVTPKKRLAVQLTEGIGMSKLIDQEWRTVVIALNILLLLIEYY